MSKGTKIIILVVLLFASSAAIPVVQANGPVEIAIFVGLLPLLFLIAIIVTALQRSDSSRRR